MKKNVYLLVTVHTINSEIVGFHSTVYLEREEAVKIAEEVAEMQMNIAGRAHTVHFTYNGDAMLPIISKLMERKYIFANEVRENGGKYEEDITWRIVLEKEAK